MMATAVADQRIQLEDTIINHQLTRRPLRRVNRTGEMAGMHSLAEVFPQGRGAVLKRLVKLAVDLCSGGSSGISVIEGDSPQTQLFRWQVLAGELEEYEGGTSPRDWSPCGECLRAGRAMLYSYPARYFTYFHELKTPIVEGLVIPMYLNDLAVGTIWIVSHGEECKFDAEDVRIMTNLGAFAAGLLRREFGADANGEKNANFQERAIVWEEYVRRMGHGDQFALAALMDETGPLVLGTALRVLGFREDAEEVVGDVYSKAWTGAGTYDARRGKVGAWLTGIARNRSIDQLRARGKGRLGQALSETEAYNSIEEFKKSVAAFEDKESIREALRTLPPDNRRPIELAYFSGFTMPEVAQYLGHPVGTIKSRIRKGLTKLRAAVAASAGGSQD